MAYSTKVLDHYRNPRNVGSLEADRRSVGTGLVGAPVCGDVIRLQILVDGEVVTEARFKTFGCASAIACSSLITERLTGATLAYAHAITAAEIAEELSLPPVKVHCSVLAIDAIAAALEDYRRKQAADGERTGGDDDAREAGQPHNAGRGEARP